PISKYAGKRKQARRERFQQGKPGENALNAGCIRPFSANSAVCRVHFRLAADARQVDRSILEVYTVSMTGNSAITVINMQYISWFPRWECMECHHPVVDEYFL
ncbi:hypothetical protein, partial [Pseudomonas syringae group genomosp. 3]|uniref:hypothetical protein n=1 Tax=Pseudomonas syringae group genomosp. 3 TaxID=251701 RepID=UPI001F1D13CE